MEDDDYTLEDLHGGDWDIHNDHDRDDEDTGPGPAAAGNAQRMKGDQHPNALPEMDSGETSDEALAETRRRRTEAAAFAAGLATPGMTFLNGLWFHVSALALSLSTFDPHDRRTVADVQQSSATVLSALSQVMTVPPEYAEDPQRLFELGSAVYLQHHAA